LKPTVITWQCTADSLFSKKSRLIIPAGIFPVSGTKNGLPRSFFCAIINKNHPKGIAIRRKSEELMDVSNAAVSAEIINIAASGTYDIVIGQGLLPATGSLLAQRHKVCKVMVITDDKVAPLYAATVEENIRFGREISDEDVEKAAKIAQAYDFITSFPDSFSHNVTTGGTNLSGGQRQRLLISRAIAGSPEILILDDSSSALDYKTDLSLRRAIAEQSGDTTVIIVAQRISSVMNSDLIIVLDEGRINGIGTHDELLKSCSIYKEISESQMGGAFLE
jgi:ATP-binding cassette subfamily B protein